MSQPDPDRSSSRRILSALADGDATDGEATRAFQAWRDDDDTRATWHTYQLIGDVMRSDDLAAEPSADRAFLDKLRARLADEPVVLAPHAPEPDAEPAAMPVPAQGVANARSGAWSRGRWQAPLAMAAGFLVVMGGYGVMRPFDHARTTSLALATPPASASLAAPVRVAGTGGAATAVQAKADAEQLAPYLAAHRQSTMNASFQMPGGDLRNVSLVQPAP